MLVCLRSFSLPQASTPFAIMLMTLRATRLCFRLMLVAKMLYFKAGDEIVDLTCESLEPVVVDLTHNDSVVVSVAV